MSTTWETIETIAEGLTELDQQRQDRTITQKEFEHFINDPEKNKSLQKIIGRDSIDSWTEFKATFIAYQEKYGFEWSVGPGKGGPVSLDNVHLPASLGTELAKIEYKKKNEQGNLKELLKNTLVNLFHYLGEDWYKIDWTEAREAFKEITFNNKSYRFTPGRSSLNYELGKQVYRYKSSNSKKTEQEFGELIYEKLKEVLRLDYLVHSQYKHNSGKYRNFDFEGFRINRCAGEDEFLMYSFELKPANRIEDISQAISQAVNYHAQSNFTYIIIPFFDRVNFYDRKRSDDLFNMCQENKLGVLSVQLDTSTHQLKDIDEIIQAPKTELDNAEKLLDLIKDSKWEKCPLCKKIVRKEFRQRCGWLVTSGDKTECMKELLEKKMLS